MWDETTKNYRIYVYSGFVAIEFTQDAPESCTSPTEKT